MDIDDLWSVRNLYWLGNYEGCIDEAEQFSPSNDREKIDRDVYLYRAYIGKGDYKKVLTEITDPASTPTDVLAVRLYANFLANKSGRESVVETVGEWLNDDLSKDNVMVQLMAGMIYFQAGDTKEALRALRNPKTMEMHALRVQIYISMNRPDLAQNELETMQKIDDDSTLTQLAHVWVNLATGGSKYQEGAYIYQEQINKTVASSMLLNGLGVCNMHMKRFNEAEKYFDEALQKDENDPDILINMISCYANQRKPHDKIDALVQRLRKAAPDHPVLAQLDSCMQTFQNVAKSHGR